MTVAPVRYEEVDGIAVHAAGGRVRRAELTDGRCQHDVTREHEHKHVEMIRATLDESAQRLRRAH